WGVLPALATVAEATAWVVPPRRKPCPRRRRVWSIRLRRRGGCINILSHHATYAAAARSVDADQERPAARAVSGISAQGIRARVRQHGGVGSPHGLPGAGTRGVHNRIDQAYRDRRRCRRA